MAAKVGLKAKAARAREEMARTGRLVLRAPALVRGAEYLIRFALAGVLAGAEILDGCAPFGLSMVGCSGSGLGGFAALLGACLGYLSFRGLAEGLRYVAAAILIFSVAFAFFDIKLYRRGWFMPAVTAALSGATGFVYLGEGGWELSAVVFFLTELLLSGACVYFYRTAFSPWLDKREEGELSTRQLASLFILGSTVLISLAQLTLVGDIISAGRVLAALAVMVFASQGGLGAGAAAGVAAGLSMDLARGAGDWSCTVCYGCAGLVTGAFQGLSRTGCAVAYVLTNAVVVLWAWQGGVELPLLYEVFAASVLFLLLPEQLLRKVRARLRREGAPGTADRAAAYVRDRLAQRSRLRWGTSGVRSEDQRGEWAPVYHTGWMPQAAAPSMSQAGLSPQYQTSWGSSPAMVRASRKIRGLGLRKTYSLVARTNSKRWPGSSRSSRARRAAPEKERLLMTPVRMPPAARRSKSSAMPSVGRPGAAASQ